MRSLCSVRRDRLFGREKEEAVSLTSRQASLVAHNLKANEQLASKMDIEKEMNKAGLLLSVRLDDGNSSSLKLHFLF